MIDKKDEPKAQKRVPKYRKGQRYVMAPKKSIHCTGIGCIGPGDDVKPSHLKSDLSTNPEADGEMAFNQHLETGTIVEA